MDFNSLWCEVMIQTHVALHLAPSSSTIYSIDKISESDIGRGHLRALILYIYIHLYKYMYTEYTSVQVVGSGLSKTFKAA